MPERFASQLLLQSALTSPLGQLEAAAYLANSRGVGFPKMRVLGKFALVYLCHGSGTFRWAKRPSVPVRAGHLLFIQPDVPHAYGPNAEEEWDEFWLIFDGPVFYHWRQQGLLPVGEPLYDLAPLHYWRRRLEAVAQPPHTRHDVIARVCELQQLLGEMEAAREAQHEGAASALWLRQACDELAQQSASGLQTARIAQRCGLGYEAFRKKFTRSMGRSPGRYHMERVIQRACELLHHRAYTNREVAHELGFCDEYHFSRRFKQITGCSPHEFRHRMSAPARRGQPK